MLLPATRLEDLIDVLPAVFVCRLEIVKLLVEARYVGFEFCRLRCQPCLYIARWRQYEPYRDIVSGPI